MHRAQSRPRLLIAFYANPDQYPPTFNAACLLSKHFEVHVVCRRTDAESRVWPAEVILHRVGPGRSVAESIAASRTEKLRELAGFVQSVRRTMRIERPAVVYAYEPHGLLAASLAGGSAPIVYHRHEVEALEHVDPWSLGGWVLRASLRLGGSAALTVFPEQGRADYYRKFVRDRREPLIVPNFPLRTTFPEPDFAAMLPDRWRSRQAFYRSSMGSANGQREAIRALRHLDPATTLRLCGPVAAGFQLELEQLAAAEGVGERVELTGYVSSFEELNRMTLGATVGLMLYRAIDANWAFSATATNKLYEYAACGVPAVVPDRRAFREFLDGERWVEFADETDPRSIAAAIDRHLADRGRYEELCRLARRRFEERFNYEAVFGPLLERILELAGRPRATQPA